MIKPALETSHAILILEGKYVLQLRENIPTISAPGTWSFFGGSIDKGEKPIDAMGRELFEELSIRPRDFKLLWHDDYFDDFLGGDVRTWFFVSDVSDVWAEHDLREGKDVGVFSFDETSQLNMPVPFRQCLRKFHKEN